MRQYLEHVIKRTPSRLDNARRWAPAAYAKHSAELRYEPTSPRSPVPPARLDIEEGDKDEDKKL